MSLLLPNVRAILRRQYVPFNLGSSIVSIYRSQNRHTERRGPELSPAAGNASVTLSTVACDSSSRTFNSRLCASAMHNRSH